MTVNRTTLLDLPLPVTGTESGTWGDVTNNGLSEYVDIAVAGMTSLTSSDFTAGALTISNTQGDSSSTNIAAGSAQYATIKTSSLAANSTITAPASNRSYRIINADSTYTLTIKASGQTGVTFLPGTTGVVAFNGTDYEIVGVVGAASATDNAIPKFDGTTGQIIQNTGVTIDDSNNVSGVAQLNATTVDTTNLEVTNIKAKDGTAAVVLTDSTGAVAVSTPLTANGGVVFNEAGADVDFRVEGDTEANLLFVDAGNDRVGIGTDTPSQRLDVSGASNTALRIINTTDSTATLILANTGSSNLNLDQVNGETIFSHGATERLRIDSSGNVGIGTNTPAKTLDVNGAIANSTTNAASGVIFTKDRAITSVSGNTGPSAFPHALALSNPDTTTDTNLASLGFNVSTSGAASNAVIAGQSLSAGNMALTFYTESSNVIGERMRIDSSGNVGIGTTSPSTLLNVQKADVSGFSANTTFDVMVIENGTSSTGAVLQIVAATNGSSEVAFSDSTRNQGLISYSHVSDAMLFRTNAAERMRIDSSGNVGIGTSSPAVALDVVGQVRASTGILFGSDTAAANALDDYEEGNFDITITPETSGSITVTTGFNSLIYTKIGRIVHITGGVGLSGVASPVGTFITIAGLPFTLASLPENQEQVGFALYYKDDSTGTRSLLPCSYTSGTSFTATITAANIQANDAFQFDFSYVTS